MKRHLLLGLLVLLSVPAWAGDWKLVWKDQYLILNLAIGGAWGGQKGIDDSIFPQRYYFDYVRVYTRDKKAASDTPQPSRPAAAS